jgi:hypothetical protein
MPRKGSRLISIEGQTYRWRAWYGHSWKDGYCIPIQLVIQLDSSHPGQLLRATFRSGRNNVWYLEDQAVTPRVVRRIVEAGLQRGWRPAESGLPLFDLDGQPFLDAELFLKRSAPELRGSGWVKLVGRLERDYRVDLRRLDFDRRTGQLGHELTVSDLWDRVSESCRTVRELYQRQDFSVPEIGWEEFAVILSEELSIPRERVQPESRLAADLGMGADIAEPSAPADQPRA